MSVAISYNESEVIERQLTVRNVKKTPPDQIRTVYEIDRCVEWIQQNNFSLVALQLPDELLCDAASLYKTINESVGKDVVNILGDTPYESCCADIDGTLRITGSQGIIKCGHSCLSPIHQGWNLPVLYIFTRLEITVQDLVTGFKSHYSDPDCSVVVLYDIRCSHVIGEFVQEISSEYPNVVAAQLDSQGTPSVNLLFGRNIQLPEGSKSLESHSFFYVGERDDPNLRNFMLYFNYSDFSYLDPFSKKCQRCEPPTRLLKQRYFLTQKAKEAQVIGIVTGTVAMANYSEMVQRIRDLVRLRERKCIEIGLKKLNPAKLANFPHVDVFVLVACPESSILETRDYYKPVITPFELEIALNPGRDWDGRYSTDFTHLLPGGPLYVELDSSLQQYEAEVSLVSGGINRLGASEPETNESGDSTLVRRDPMTVGKFEDNPTFRYFRDRSWQGLEQRLGQDPTPTIREGRAGIAMGYTHENAENSNK